MLAREAELRGEVLAHDVAVEQRHRPAADLEQLELESASDGALAGARQAGEEEREALARPRRMAPRQLARHFGKGEPLRDLRSLLEPAPQLGAGERQRARPRLAAPLELVLRQEAVLVRQEDHLLEGDHLDADLALVLPHQLLRLVGTVIGPPGLVLAGAGVVATDDEVGAAVIAAHDGVEHRLARPRHAHRDRQQREARRLRRIAVEQRLIAAHAREMVDVPRLGHADRGMDQQAAADLLGGAAGEFEVGPVHRVAGLEGDDLAPAAPCELGAQLVGRLPQVDEVEVRRQAQDFERAADREVVGPPQQVLDPRMVGVAGGVDRLGLGHAVVLPDLVDGEHRERQPLRVAQHEPRAGGELRRQLFLDVERHRDRPERAVGQAHLAADRLDFFPAHEAGERREAADRQELEIAELARRQVPRGEADELRAQLGGAGWGARRATGDCRPFVVKNPRWRSAPSLDRRCAALRGRARHVHVFSDPVPKAERTTRHSVNPFLRREIRSAPPGL